ncbi:MAG TPA: hypothetical protein VMV27_07705 [Candidatus Binataceae bacterium]|nr:hypothetical protein [Candidatus Binataceae bacterium]
MIIPFIMFAATLVAIGLVVPVIFLPRKQPPKMKERPQGKPAKVIKMHGDDAA